MILMTFDYGCRLFSGTRGAKETVTWSVQYCDFAQLHSYFIMLARWKPAPYNAAWHSNSKWNQFDLKVLEGIKWPHCIVGVSELSTYAINFNLKRATQYWLSCFMLTLQLCGLYLIFSFFPLIDVILEANPCKRGKYTMPSLHLSIHDLSN